jgi:Family of unknown function (DUF6312)
MRFPSSVRRIALVEPGPDGTAVKVVFRRRPKRKKQSVYLRDVEKVVRDVAKAEQAAVSSYLSRHNRSNREARDGWASDYVRNVWKATRQGLKHLDS